AIGPFVGGWLVQAVSWRLIFLINVPLALIVVWIALHHLPETRDPGATHALDVLGTTVAAAGLAGVSYALTEGGNLRWRSPSVLVAGIGGALALAVVGMIEPRSKH